eukprot:7113877-Pyramimonas_sp.AAC.2
MHELCPPKPKELDSATLIFIASFSLPTSWRYITAAVHVLQICHYQLRVPRPSVTNVLPSQTDRHIT